MSMESKYIWMNGELVEFEKATVPFLTPALHYGAAVFEGIRCYDSGKGPAIFRLREHIERLVNSARIFGFLELPYTVDELVAATKETVAVNEFNACYIRPLIYLSSTNLGLNLAAGGRADVGIAAWEWGSLLGKESLEKGIRAMVSSFTRHHPNITMTKAKVAGNYANSIMAKTDSARLGFDEAIMLDPQGYVAECTGENLFIVRNGVIYTPHLAAVLEGITRDSLITLASELGIQVVECPIGRDMLYIADEVFMSGTAAECVPVYEIDQRTIGSGMAGPVTRALQQAFNEVIGASHPRSDSWLDPIK